MKQRQPLFIFLTAMWSLYCVSGLTLHRLYGLERGLQILKQSDDIIYLPTYVQLLFGYII